MACRIGVVLAVAVLLVSCKGRTEQAEDASTPVSTLDLEHERYESVSLNYDHIQTYSFQLSHVEDFIVAVDTEETIRGNVRVYWEQ